jgi:hypothetical protein
MTDKSKRRPDERPWLGSGQDSGAPRDSSLPADGEVESAFINTEAVPLSGPETGEAPGTVPPGPAIPSPLLLSDKLQPAGLTPPSASR